MADENINAAEKTSPWEKIDDSSDRLAVPGGWIVRSWYSSFKSGGGIHQVFIPGDLGHEWMLS